MMRKKIVLFVLLTLGISLCAEDYPIDTINGKAVYTYSVQKSEGLYRISKNFGVTQEEIIKWNPEIAQTGLRVGQKIHIPIVETIDSTKYIVHTIAAKETLWGLAHKYGTNVDAIQKLNPETAVKMQIGSKLLIPNPDTNNTKVVAKQETKEKSGKDIIPVFGTIEKQEQTNAVSEDKATAYKIAPIDTTQQTSIKINVQPQIIAERPIIENDNDSIMPSDSLPLRIAFLLPFMTESLNRDANIDRFLDFYEGALIAIYDAQKHGQKFEIYTYDIDKTESCLQKVLSNPELMNIDFIIGPAYSNQVDKVGAFAQEYKKNVLIPFTSTVNNIEKNPYLWQFNVTNQVETEMINAYLQEHKIQRLSLGLDMFVNDTLYTMLTDSVEYLLDIQTPSYGDIDRIMPKLEQLHQSYKFYLLSKYSWQNNNIKVPTLYTSAFSGNNILKKTAYELSYNRYFHHEHASETPRYDILGYDLTMFMIRHHLRGDMTYTGIRSNISFTQVSSEGGYMNKELQIITTK